MVVYHSLNTKVIIDFQVCVFHLCGGIECNLICDQLFFCRAHLHYLFGQNIAHKLMKLILAIDLSIPFVKLYVLINQEILYGAADKLE